MKYIACLLILLATVSTQGQTHKYIVYFKDKANSPFQSVAPSTYLTAKSLARRARQNISLGSHDLPVNPAYVSQVAATGAVVWYTSRWLNAAIIECDSLTNVAVQGLSCVQSSTGRPLFGRKTNYTFRPTKNTQDLFDLSKPPSLVYSVANQNYGNCNPQISMLGIDSMHTDGFTGAGITIAVIDAGFNNADRHQAFDNMRRGGRILGTYDFVLNQTGNVYREANHGSAVLSIMGGYLDGKLIGPAYDASYYLFRTENTASEYEIECANWVIAAERADSLGCDLINSSLGYNIFDDSTTNYSISQLDGRSTFLSRAATMTGRVGMLTFCSAGNTGGSGDPWYGKITMPSDADSVMTIGAVDLRGTIARFSSVGPTTDGRIKPDVASPGAGVVVINALVMDAIVNGSGTSYASPITCGLAAGIWQAYPWLSAMDLAKLIRQSGTQATTPDSVMGYGIPSYTRAKRIITGLPKAVAPSFPNPCPAGSLLEIGPGNMPVMLVNTLGQSWQLTRDATKVQLPHVPAGNYWLWNGGKATQLVLY